MRKFFSFDSPLMQSLATVADYMLLNILFLICSIPIVTMGAAKTALYRVMFDMLEEKGNTFKRFFKAFASELKTITVGLQDFIGLYGAQDWGATFASICISTIPTLAIYFALNGKVTNGMTMGATKG